MNISEAKTIAISLSKPSKMPGKGYGLPALETCKVGTKLAKVAGSTCASCYACKGNYLWDNVKKAQRARAEAVYHPLWPQAMAKLIGKQKWFRWHDSGDLMSVEHLEKIVQVAKLTPNTNHWLPTKELGLVKRWVKSNTFPDNLTVRLSAAMMDGNPPAVDLPTATVHLHNKVQGVECRAPSQGGKCEECRLCWDKSVKNISYKAH